MKLKNLVNGIMILAALALLVPATMVAAGAPKEAALGSAVVDGNIGEWDLATDFFGSMHRAGKLDFDILANLYLRYDCSSETLYALVLSDDPVDTNASEAWIALGSISNKVSFDEFAWVYDNGTAIGWEASFSLAPQQDYSIYAHTNVDDGSGWQTAGTNWLDLRIYCPPTPTAVQLVSFTAAADGSSIRLSWETASELDNLGFNIYRAEPEGKARVRINDSLIASKAPGSFSGGSYEFVDAAVSGGQTYTYWLESLDLRGGSAEYGPVSATAAASYRRILIVRPRIAPIYSLQISR
jgi:hypothetical protein